MSKVCVCVCDRARGSVREEMEGTWCGGCRCALCCAVRMCGCLVCGGADASTSPTGMYTEIPVLDAPSFSLLRHSEIKTPKTPAPSFLHPTCQGVMLTSVLPACCDMACGRKPLTSESSTCQAGSRAGNSSAGSSRKQHQQHQQPSSQVSDGVAQHNHNKPPNP